MKSSGFACRFNLRPGFQRFKAEVGLAELAFYGRLGRAQVGGWMTRGQRGQRFSGLPRASLFLVGYFPHLFFSGAMWHKRCWTLCFLRQDQFSGKPKLRHLLGQLHSGSEESKEGSTSFWGSPIVKSLWKYRRKNSRKPRKGSPAHFCQGKQGLTCASFHSTLVSLPV